MTAIAAEPTAAIRSGSGVRPPKITMIGAGGVTFPLRLMGDLLSFEALQGASYSLMDIDLERAERNAGWAREVVGKYGFGATVEATDDRRAALDGADFVIITFMVGGVDVYRHDMEIPRKYGVDQRIGDTLGPGGVFRFLRNVPALTDIARDMHEVCPNAILINYANPMAMNCWYLEALGIRTVGLCHSVQGTSKMLAEFIDVDYDDVAFRCGGINHQAWFTEFRRGDEDLYPRIREVMNHKYVEQDLQDRGIWGGERVRTEIMNAFGLFHTESSPHASEYLPYFRKNDARSERYGTAIRWSFDDVKRRNEERQVDRTLVDSLLANLEPSHEYGAWIVNATVSGQPTVIYGNVPNDGLIDNLPPDCCVEVACLVDRNGVQPTHFGALPSQCAAVNQTNINVQRLAVRAALTGEKEHVYHAIMLDPLTAAICTLDEIRSMTDELFAVHEGWLPELR